VALVVTVGDGEAVGSSVTVAVAVGVVVEAHGSMGSELSIAVVLGITPATAVGVDVGGHATAIVTGVLVRLICVVGDATSIVAVVSTVLGTIVAVSLSICCKRTSRAAAWV
jgi:hypothetical protein